MKHDIHPAYMNGATSISLGCTLGYYACAPTPASFLIQADGRSAAAILEESLFLSSGAAMQDALDAQGNRVLISTLVRGHNEIRYEATVQLPLMPESEKSSGHSDTEFGIPLEVSRYTLPSRYCESDKLHDFARKKFSHLERGLAQARAICDWVGRNFAYRHGSGDATLSACEAMQRGYGVCRDFAHIMIALCRALELPARYVAAYVPIMRGNEVDGENDIGIDFHAYAEVYAEGCWHVFDARYKQPLKGRIKIAHGMDAVDAAFATFYGNVDVVKFEVWARECEPVS